MPFGPGKYDDVCTAARCATGGSVLLIVFDGDRGSGFSAQVAGALLGSIPGVLREVADQIEQSTRSGSGR